MQNLPSLVCRLGLLESADRHLRAAGNEADLVELQRLRNIERHFSRCIDARRLREWQNVIRESDAAVVAGADSAPRVLLLSLSIYIWFGSSFELRGQMMRSIWLSLLAVLWVQMRGVAEVAQARGSGRRVRSSSENRDSFGGHGHHISRSVSAYDSSANRHGLRKVQGCVC